MDVFLFRLKRILTAHMPVASCLSMQMSRWNLKKHLADPVSWIFYLQKLGFSSLRKQVMKSPITSGPVDGR